MLGDRGNVTRSVQLPKELTSALQSFCRNEHVTPFMVTYSAFAALLHRCSGQEDFCVGVPVSGRTHPATEDVVGLFVNTLPLRTRTSSAQSFADLLRDVRETTLGAFAHQDIPFERIVDALQLPRSLSHSPLVQVMFVWETVRPPDRFAEVRVAPRQIDHEDSKFDLTFSVAEATDGFELSLEYNSDLYERGSAERMVAQFIVLLEQALKTPAAPLSRLSLLDEAQQQRVLVEFNDTERPFDAQATLASLFEAQVARTPDAVAVVASDGTLTFRELDEKATRLARHLAALGAGPESVVGLCLERRSELIVALLAIARAGAAYLPLEPSHPSSRRAELLRRAGAHLVVSRPALFSDVDVAVPIIAPDATGAEATPTAPRPDQLAVLLYTSGSTGEPKGVELTHRNIVHAFASFDALYGTAPGDCWAASASISFDMHLEDIVYPLSRGARVVLREVGPAGLVADIARHGITHLKTTPTLLSFALDEDGSDPDLLQSLSVVITGGEVLSPSLVQQLQATRARLFNSYGPTETTIISTAEELQPGHRFGMGRPLDRATCYVLDAFGAPVPVGVPGELFIGGAGVARGYRNRPDLTSERFLPDPFSSVSGARMYRTGDRVRWNDDGTLSFLGRTDFQVKVRGIRIELEEIEAALLRIPGVRHAAVLARKSLGQTRLDAFLVVDGLSASDVRERLSASVPEAMVPARFTLVDALPVTASGKVDRKALADLPVSDPEPVTCLRAAARPARSPHRPALRPAPRPRTGRPRPRLLRARRSLPQRQSSSSPASAGPSSSTFPLSAVFAHPSVAGLARVVQAAAPAAATFDGPVRRPADAPLLLSHAQERMWFLQQLHPESTAYNVPTAFELQGPLAVEALEQALHLLVERHHALRLVVGAHDGEPSPALLDVPSTSSPSRTHSDQGLRSEATRSFDLARGPLFRFTLFRISPERHVLLLAFHHIVVDGLSLEVLLRELSDAYAALVEGRAPELRPIALDYFDVAHGSAPSRSRPATTLSSTTGSSSSKSSPGSSSFQRTFPRPSVLGDRGGVIGSARLRPELAQALRAFCRSEQVTPFMAMFSTFAALLHRCSGQDDVCIGVPVSGRTHPATEDVVGLFVNTLPLRSRSSASQSFAELIREVRDTTLDAFAHQDMPFERIVDALQLPRSLSHSPIFQVMFAWESIQHSRRLAEVRVAPHQVDHEDSKFDLTFSVTETPEGFELFLEYNSDLYEKGSAERMVTQFVDLLRAGAPLARHAALATLPARRGAEAARPRRLQRHLPPLRRAGHPGLPVRGAGRAHPGRRRRRRRRRHPHLPRARREGHPPRPQAADAAHRAGHARRTLPRAAQRAHRRAAGDCQGGRRLSPAGAIAPGAVVAPSCSGNRVPTCSSRARGSSTGSSSISRGSLLTRRAPAVPLPRPSSDQLACVLYTSGSTGEPKGVEMTHRNIVHAFASFDALYGSAPGDCWVASASISFDMHLEDIVYPLSRGARVVLREVGPAGLVADIAKHAHHAPQDHADAAVLRPG